MEDRDGSVVIVSDRSSGAGKIKARQESGSGLRGGSSRGTRFVNYPCKAAIVRQNSSTSSTTGWTVFQNPSKALLMGSSTLYSTAPSSTGLSVSSL